MVVFVRAFTNETHFTLWPASTSVQLLLENICLYIKRFVDRLPLQSVISHNTT